VPARARLVLIAASVLTVAAVGVGVFFAVRGLTEEDDEAPAPPVALKEEGGAGGEEPEAAEELGFPAFATKNTTRIGGGDEAANAAGAALATFPSVGGVDRPAAVTLVPSSDWAAGIAASVLVSEPIRAPILVGDADGVPDETETALDALRPEGSSETTDAQVLRVGNVEVPGDLRALEVPGGSAAEIANEVDRVRQRLSGEKPQNIVLASTEDPAFAMPAAAWAARSGDPVLFVERDTVPEATIEALERHEGVPAFLIGPESVASEKVVSEVEKHAPAVQRISGEDPVTSAIEFARFDAGTFGWNITDPGHGLVIANSSRPLDAAAAAPLSASGKWGPLVVTDDADAVPTPLRGFLLDIKPGYRSDPSRAFYNHAWLIGDNSALSIAFQAQLDDALELVRIETGAPERTGAAQSGGRD